MINLAFTLIPSVLRAAESEGPSRHPVADDEGVLGKLLLWLHTQLRYERALHELRKLDDRDLDDLNLARADFAELAWRCAVGEAPLAPHRR
jgi:uncharacterized protein YjiS (DUF1127 family)